MKRKCSMRVQREYIAAQKRKGSYGEVEVIRLSSLAANFPLSIRYCSFISSSRGWIKSKPSKQICNRDRTNEASSEK